MTIDKTDIFDLMLPNSQRFQMLLEMDSGVQFETIKRFMDIYRLSKVKKLEKFLIHVCIFDRHIDLYLKQEILFILMDKLTLKNSKQIQRAYSNVLYIILQKAFKYKECWYMLEEALNLFKTNFKEEISLTLLKNITTLSFKHFSPLNSYNETFKLVFSLMSIFKAEEIFVRICIFIYHNFKDKLMIKSNLLLLQILFQHENIFMDDLFLIINDNNIELNLKLEACDILYLKGSENVKNKVQKILERILPDVEYTNNSENVHLKSVVASVDKTIDSILKSNKGKKAPCDLHKILISKLCGSNHTTSSNHTGSDCNSKADKIKSSLNRIFNYNFLKFSKHKITLKEIIENVWLKIEDCEFKNELYLRLEEELIDMNDTCSQGYVTRLINIFSGFDLSGCGITISYEDEIFAIFSNKINQLVSTAPQPLKEQLLEELMVPSNDYENRLNLIRFLRPYLPSVWNEIFEMFKDHLTITDLDLYCRKVTMRYEGC
jgi:hypothetical protein